MITQLAIETVETINIAIDGHSKNVLRYLLFFLTTVNEALSLGLSVCIVDHTKTVR